MFPSGGGSKKRGGFKNLEPSSPKVTCIGQVRVKTKKQGKKMRMISSRSKRSRNDGGVGGAKASFRKAEASLSGGEVKKDEENKGGVRSESGNSSCGAVFARWFVMLEDGNKRREIELVVGEEEEEVRTAAPEVESEDENEGMEEKEKAHEEKEELRVWDGGGSRRRRRG